MSCGKKHKRKKWTMEELDLFITEMVNGGVGFTGSNAIGGFAKPLAPPIQKKKTRSAYAVQSNTPQV